MERVQSAMKNFTFRYWLLLVLLVLIFVGREVARRRQSNKSWLKLRSRSPDPEKSDDVGKFAKEKLKPTDRPPGSESLNRSMTKSND